MFLEKVPEYCNLVLDIIGLLVNRKEKIFFKCLNLYFDVAATGCFNPKNSQARPRTLDVAGERGSPEQEIHYELVLNARIFCFH